MTNQVQVVARRRRVTALIGACFVSGLFAITLGATPASAEAAPAICASDEPACNPCDFSYIDDATASTDNNDTNVHILKCVGSGADGLVLQPAAGWTFSAPNADASDTTDANGEAKLTFDESLFESCEVSQGVDAQGGCEVDVTITESGTDKYSLHSVDCWSDSDFDDLNVDPETRSFTLTDIDSDEDIWCTVVNINVSDLSIAKTGPAEILAGSEISYTVTVTNNGPNDTVEPIVVEDAVPTGTTFISGTGTGWTCALDSGTVTCTRDSSLGDGASSAITLKFQVTAAAGATVKNCATVFGETAGLNPHLSAVEEPDFEANNTACDSASGIQVKAALAFTGSNSAQMAGLGLGAALLGLGTTVLARRRRTNA